MKEVVRKLEREKYAYFKLLCWSTTLYNESLQIKNLHHHEYKNLMEKHDVEYHVEKCWSCEIMKVCRKMVLIIMQTIVW